MCGFLVFETCKNVTVFYGIAFAWGQFFAWVGRFRVDVGDCLGRGMDLVWWRNGAKVNCFDFATL